MNNNEDLKVGYNENSEHMTLGNWVITLLLMCIPLVNIILVFVWAFGSDVNKSKKTFFQAQLIFGAISIVLMIIFGSAIFAIIGNM